MADNPTFRSILGKDGNEIVASWVTNYNNPFQNTIEWVKQIDRYTGAMTSIDAAVQPMVNANIMHEFADRWTNQAGLVGSIVSGLSKEVMEQYSKLPGIREVLAEQSRLSQMANQAMQMASTLEGSISASLGGNTHLPVNKPASERSVG